jgi:proteasome lid subunit RPN8/RPN11
MLAPHMLKLAERAYAVVIEHVRAEYPREACGFLLGVDGYAIEVLPAHNVHPDAHSRYEASPHDYLDAERTATARGIAIVGFYHSHPDGPAIPSATDLTDAVAIWGDSPSWSYFVLAVDEAGRIAARSWVLRERAFVAEQVLEQTEPAT